MAGLEPNTKAVQAQLRARSRTIEDAYADIIDEHGRGKGKALIRKALRPVFASLIQRGKAATPVRKGVLRRGVMVKPRQRRGFIFGVQYGYFARRRVSAVLGAEFGNVRTRAHSALRESFAQEEDRAEGELADALEREVDAAAAKANRNGRRRLAAAKRRR